MKQKLFTLLTLLLCLCSGAWADDVTINRFALNGTTIYPINTTDKMLYDEVVFSTEETPTLENNVLKVSANKYVTISANGNTISKIVIVWNNANNSTTADSGELAWANSNKTMTWTGSATSVKFTSGVSTRINSAVITYTDDNPLSSISSTTLTGFSRVYSSSGAAMYSSKSPAAPGVNINGGLGSPDSDGKVQLTKGSSDALFTNGLHIKSPRAISSVVYTWDTAPTATSLSSGTYNAETSTWTAPNTETKEVTLYNRGTAAAKFTQIVVNFAASAATHTITLDDNGEYQGNGTATATEESATLTNITAPKRDGYVVEGYYDDAIYSNKVATAAGTLQPSTAYTDANSKWTSTSDEVSLYAKWEAVELANTTGTKTWTFDDTNITSGSKTAASSSIEYVYSSISGMTFGNDFDATALSFKGGYPYYSGGGQHISQGSQWKFHPTVDGRVMVSWYSAGGADATRYLSVGGTAAGSTNNTKVTSDAVDVSADADVVIAGYSDESLETAAYIDVTEIAFTATPYTLKYDANGATSGVIPATATKYAEGDEVTVLGNTGSLEKDGKTFAGWNTQADGLGTDYAADAVLTIGTADVTLYAKWASEYTVTHTLTNVTKTSGATTAYENTQYTAVFAANTNYDLPEAITVTAGGSNITESCTWTKATGTVVIPAAQVTGNIEITVTGVEHVAPTAGVIYSLTTNSASLSSVTLNTEVNLVPTYATISGGGAYLGNQNNSDNSNANKAQVNSSKGIYLGGNDAYIKLILNEPLKTGDVITFVNGDGTKQICFTTTATRATTNSTSSYSYTCAEAFNDKSTIYIWRSEGSATYVKSLTITRKNSVTLNNKSGATYGFSTFCSPNNFTVTGATAYKASLDEGKLNLTEIDGIIPAGAGVILAGEPGATVNIAYTTSNPTANMEGNALSGTTARTETATLKGSNTYFYAFQNTTNTFKEYTGTFFPANKAYVVSNTATSSREMTMEFGETTGISNLIVNDNANIDANAPMYNLAGQKVSKNYKGIVIVNGKKYVRK